jgi:hypothetical protein
MNSEPKTAVTAISASRQGKRKYWMRGALLLLVVLAALAVSAPTMLRRAAPAANPQELAALTQRCQTEMLRGTCGAMNASAPKAGASRLFIAGVGEVDADAFAALRAAGDQMCSEAAVACNKDWNSKTCRITRALYPLTVMGSGKGAASGTSGSK